MKYVCKKCGDCCRRFEMFIEPGDMQSDAHALRLAQSVGTNFGVKFADIKRVSVTVYGTCRALDKKTKLCKVYSDRPKRCRLYKCRRFGDVKKKK